MSYILNDKVRQLVPYEPAEGDYSIRLDAKESFVTLPVHIQSEINLAFGQVDYRRYPDPLAQSCLQAFANLYSLKLDNITAGNGSDELISVILSGLFQRGERLLLTSSDFSMYEFYAHVAELQVVNYTKTEDYQIDVQAMIDIAQKEKCAGIMFSNPCNPTSQGITRAEVIQILEDLPSTLVIVDEAYMEFWDQTVVDLIDQYDNLLVLKTCSKAFGGAAIRLGFAVSGIVITKALRSLKSPYNVNSFTQAAGTVLLNHSQCLKKATAQIIASRDDLYKQLLKQQPFNQKLGLNKVLKPNTNFILASFRNPQKVFEFLKEQGILVRCFPDFLRITAGKSEENQAVIQALQNYGEEQL